jgi:nucleotide-binding universal stress UspA family protein
MPTITLTAPVGFRTVPRRKLEQPIILATDGKDQSSGAFAAAVAIAAGGTRRGDQARKLPVHVITVCDALPIVAPEIAPVLPHEFLEGRREDMLDAAREQLRYNVRDSSSWRVEAMSGPPAPTIADAADEIDASLIVMGLGKHDLYERVFGTETALQVMRQSHVPVLAVPQNWIGIPRHLVIAVDFGAASLRAARTAMRIAAPGASVCFAHVAPDLGLPFESEDDLSSIYRTDLNEEFGRFIAAVGVPDDALVTRVVLHGDPARAILDFAHAEGNDMIVAGTHGRNALARLFVGSVASKLVRGAQCAVLVTSERRPRRDDTTSE